MFGDRKTEVRNESGLKNRPMPPPRALMDEATAMEQNKQLKQQIGQLQTRITNLEKLVPIVKELCKIVENKQGDGSESGSSFVKLDTPEQTSVKSAPFDEDFADLGPRAAHSDADADADADVPPVRMATPPPAEEPEDLDEEPKRRSKKDKAKSKASRVGGKKKKSDDSNDFD